MGDLRARLADRIRSDGPITFAEYMDVALYDPDEGFYSRPPVGARGDFVTSPHVSAIFGDLLAAQLHGCWERLGKPEPFHVIEAGAGDGTLAKQITASLGVPHRYAAVERSAGARDALRRAGIETFASLEDAGKALTGCLVANELLDNLAFHRFRKSGVEVMVGLDGDAFIEVEGPPTIQVPDGAEIASPATLEFVRDAIGLLERGYVILYDYAYSQVRAYEAHRMHDRMIVEPGSADITAGVDFDAVAAEATRHGATVWGPQSQRTVLLALGYKRAAGALRERRQKAEAARESREILRLISEQSKTPLLVDEANLGSLKVIAFGVRIDEPPPGFDVQ